MAKLIEITGKAISGEWGIEDADGSGIPVLRTTNFTNEGIVNYENIVTRKISKKNIDKKYLIQGDIIIEKSGGSDKQPVGRVVFFEGLERKYLFNNYTGLLRIKDRDKWEPKYVFYSLYSNYRKGGTKAFENKTTGLHNLKTDDYISKFNIKDTAIEEQRSICRKLDAICEIIKLKQEQFSKLDELIKSQFVEMFGDPVQNPKGWRTKSFLDMGNCKNGMNFHYAETGIAINCLGVGDFKDLDIIGDVEKLSRVTLNEMPSEEYLLKDGDIVFVRSNGNRALVGRSLVVYPKDVSTTFSGFCIRYRKTDDTVTIPYLLRVLKTNSMRQKMVGRGANIQNLNQQILGTLEIPIPPIELQNQFAVFVRHVDKQKSTTQKSINNLQTLFDSLMQKYFG